MRLGLYPADLAAGSRRRARRTARPTIEERHRHRYEVNNAYRDQLEAAGLVFSGTNPDLDLVEFVELPRDVHPYYVATQAHPELRSRPTRPHPLFTGLIGAALERQTELRFPIDETGLRREPRADGRDAVTASWPTGPSDWPVVVEPRPAPRRLGGRAARGPDPAPRRARRRAVRRGWSSSTPVRSWCWRSTTRTGRSACRQYRHAARQPVRRAARRAARRPTRSRSRSAERELREEAGLRGGRVDAPALGVLLARHLRRGHPLLPGPRPARGRTAATSCSTHEEADMRAVLGAVRRPARRGARRRGPRRAAGARG